MSPRSVEDERRAAAWLAGLAAVLLLLGALVVVQEGSSGGQPDDEPAGEVIDRSAPEDDDAEPAPRDQEDPGTGAEDAETAQEPTTDASPEDASAAPDEGDGAGAAAGAALWGRWFRLTEIRDGEETADPVGDEPYLVGFAQEEGAAPERGALRWRGPCNAFGAQVAVAPERLLVGEVGGTAAGCDDALQEQDAAVTRLLAESPVWTLGDGGLVLRSQGRALALAEDPDATPPPGP